MAIYLVRHAKAGDPLTWEGDDRVRPLTKKGRRQAEHLAERFAGIDVPVVVSSPYLRCVQTVEPVARAKGLQVIPDEMLAYAGSFVDVIELLERLPDGAVACSHGDVIPETISGLYRRGMEIDGTEDWRKGTTWVLQRDAAGRVVSGTVWPPPPDD
jgi:8-oxo-dGTP diphosphatase